jgi:hypothetical protein
MLYSHSLDPFAISKEVSHVILVLLGLLPVVLIVSEAMDIHFGTGFKLLL